MRIVSLPAGVATTPAAAQALQPQIAVEAGREAAVSAWRGRGLLRVSGQACNRATDYARLAKGLPGVLATASRQR